MRLARLRPPAAPLVGSPLLPGDKSVSIRRALLSLLTARPLTLPNFTTGADGYSALNCLRELGKSVTAVGNAVTISGAEGATSATIDCGNSGTTARLLMGLLCGRAGEWTITGDESLSRRPMERVAVPLREMGAQIELDGGHLPARIRGASLKAIRHISPVASAQVKSAVMFAALHATGITYYREEQHSRDHTERLLDLHAASDGWIDVNPDSVALDMRRLAAPIPGDPSAAVFWIAAALLVPESRIRLHGVLLSPLRTAFINVLCAAGAQIRIEISGESGGETVGDIEVHHSTLRPLQIRAQDIPALIDELPVLMILAARHSGGTFLQVGELRFKESDRLHAVTDGLRRMHADLSVEGDDVRISGGELRGAPIDPAGDHRIAMTFAIAALGAKGEATITDPDCAAISDAGFWTELQRLAPDAMRTGD